MGRRREGREAAIQFLFARDMQGTEKPESPEVFWTLHSAKSSTRAFAESLIHGVLENQSDIDARIAALLQNFRIERLAAVDRNVLRVAAYELMHCPEVPAPVILNEAIDIAKALSAGESGYFVNSGACSRWAFANEILRLAGVAAANVPILSSAYPRASTPPPFAALHNRAGAALGITLRPWPEALADYMQNAL